MQELLLELIRELANNDKLMWVVGGGSVVSENNARGVKEPEISNGYVTLEADNWHFHLPLAQTNGVQFVEAISHAEMRSYYVRFSKDWEETLARAYFPNPYMDEDHQRVPFQPEKLRAFEACRDRYVGRDEGVVFVQRTNQPSN